MENIASSDVALSVCRKRPLCCSLWVTECYLEGGFDYMHRTVSKNLRKDPSSSVCLSFPIRGGGGEGQQLTGLTEEQIEIAGVVIPVC